MTRLGGAGRRRCRTARRTAVASGIAWLILLASAGLAQAATISVNTTNDGAPNASECSQVAGDCSLRQAIDKAQSGDTIQLAGSAGSPATYPLTVGATLSIAKNLTIDGNGSDATTIDGSQNLGGQFHEQYRIMTVASGAAVSISGVTFSHGIDANDENFQSCSPCNTTSGNGGGALFNNGGSVTLDKVAFTKDSGSATPVGGAISNAVGTLNMTDVSFTDDGAAFGGGLFVRSGSVTGNGVTFENNGGGSFGGGAAFVWGGSLSLTNATIVGNGSASSFGGGIVNAGGTLSLTNDTLSGNSRGAIETDQFATTKVTNTIIGAGFSDGSDFACIAPGKTDSATGGTTAKAITSDLGNNIDQDGSCGLSGTGDLSSVDPKLASIADNGGSTRTQALVNGSPAIDAAKDSSCPATDQTGTARPQGPHCDIGAFEAVFKGAPTTATTDAAQNINQTQADLEGHINLDGEAGGFHFVWGTSPQEPSNPTAEVGAGVVASDTAESQTLQGLNAGTTYYYQVVADNASGSRTGAIQSFTTSPAGPIISNASFGSVTDTTVTLNFSIDPQGSDTTYVVGYGTDQTYGQQTQPVDIGSQGGAQQLSTTITGLTPATTYHFHVTASNGQGSADSGDQPVSTSRQVPAAVTGVTPTPGTPPGSAQTFATKAAPPPEAPVLGRSLDAKPVSGVVLIETAHGFVPLTETVSLRSGTVIDARLGTLQLIAAAIGRGKTQVGAFGGAVFKFVQDRSGLTTLSLLEGAFSGAPTYASCKAKKAADTLAPGAHVAVSSQVLQTLHSSAHGHFRTRGRYAAATVRGTAWTTTDRCDGTLISVQLHAVEVTDFVRHVTVLVHQGHSYLARPKH